MIFAALNGRVPLIGFSGSPWTLASYMVEGRGSKTFSRIKGMLYSEPLLLHRLLDKLAQSVISYLNAQIAAGAQAVQIFDTWGGMLTELQYMQQIVECLTRESAGRRVPVILFTKGGSLWLDAMADTGCDAVGLDWMLPISKARARVGDRVALQGNLDPSALYADADSVCRAARGIIEDFGQGSGHVFNLGHGITPDIDPENVRILVDTVHEYSAGFHND